MNGGQRAKLRAATHILLVPLLPPPLDGVDFTGTVDSVDDGDTIAVRHLGSRETIRRADVDCPEIGQADSPRAREHTSALVLRREVRARVTGSDALGRTLARVETSEGTSLNEDLVRVGLAC